MRLRDDAQRIWQAGVDAVDSVRLTASQLRVDAEYMYVSDQVVHLQRIRHVEIVGAGKAGSGMARGVEQALKNLPKSISISGRSKSSDTRPHRIAAPRFIPATSKARFKAERCRASAGP